MNYFTFFTDKDIILKQPRHRSILTVYKCRRNVQAKENTILKIECFFKIKLIVCDYHKLQPNDKLLTFFLKCRRNVRAKETTIFSRKNISLKTENARLFQVWRSSRLLQWWVPHHRQNRRSYHHPCWAYRPCRPCLKTMMILNVAIDSHCLTQRIFDYEKSK
jgi:hypothetical protein